MTEFHYFVLMTKTTGFSPYHTINNGVLKYCNINNEFTRINYGQYSMLGDYQILQYE